MRQLKDILEAAGRRPKPSKVEVLAGLIILAVFYSGWFLVDLRLDPTRRAAIVALLQESGYPRADIRRRPTFGLCDRRTVGYRWSSGKAWGYACASAVPPRSYAEVREPRPRRMLGERY
jgi:hypothetical protein